MVGYGWMRQGAVELRGGTLKEFFPANFPRECKYIRSRPVRLGTVGLRIVGCSSVKGRNSKRVPPI